MIISQKYQGVCMYADVYHSIFLTTRKITCFESFRIGEFYNQILRHYKGNLPAKFYNILIFTKIKQRRQNMLKISVLNSFKHT